MKVVYILSGLALAVVLAGCANNRSANIPVPAPDASQMSMQDVIRQPNVSGTAWIRQPVTLPPNAVLTVTLSDASLADTPSIVLSQKVARLDGNQAPFSFLLPFNPGDIKQNARILLSAAITVDNRLMFITDKVQPVVNNGVTKADLTLVPVQNQAMPVQIGDGAVSTMPLTSPTQVTPSSSLLVPTGY